MLCSDFKVDAVSLTDMDFWDGQAGGAGGRERPGKVLEFCVVRRR